MHDTADALAARLHLDRATILKMPERWAVSAASRWRRPSTRWRAAAAAATTAPGSTRPR
jgi:hypothetical protein